MFLTGKTCPVFAEKDWFGGYLPSHFEQYQYALINSYGYIQTSHSPEFKDTVKSVTSGFHEQAFRSSEVKPLTLEENKQAWLLPIANDCEFFTCLILANEDELIEQPKAQLLYLQMMYDLGKARLASTQHRLQLAEDWIRDEMDEITRIQQLMLPEKSFAIHGVDIAFEYRAMKGAGGDYIDIADLSNRSPGDSKEVGIIIADVSGHGPAAAVETAMIDAILRTYNPESEEPEPAEVLEYINRYFFTRKGRGSFLTAAVFHYSEEKNKITYANAGHPYAYLKHGQACKALDQGGIPIGVMREQTWQNHYVDVEHGDTLFLYTDVVVENQNSNQEEFGFSRLEQGIAQSPARPIEMLAFLEGKMREFCGCTEFQDDLTMCAIQFL